MTYGWKWDPQSKTYGNYGNANQWTVNAGLESLARETVQNSNDARTSDDAEMVFTYIRLTGEARRDFLDTLHWADELRPHLEAMTSSAAGSVSAGQLRQGLAAVERSDSLVLLRVSDHGCRGLTGPEFPDDGTDEKAFGNFIKLCRLDLFSGKDTAAGGSFGLGKAVYWRFSRLQTVLFNSTVSPFDAVDGRSSDRLFGVNPGSVHTIEGQKYQGRGYFGAPDEGGDVRSVWGYQDLVRRLYVARPDDRPGTTALLVGFYDPDEPDRYGDGPEDLHRELRQSVEASFWPLLARGRMRVRLEVEENGVTVASTVVDPSETYTELVRALRRYDAGDVDETLDAPDAVVVRDVPVQVSARREPAQPTFRHDAKLVVTLSDDQPDTLENRVCLLRQPEMVVQHVDKQFEGVTYHAFLLAGGAVERDATDELAQRADDFLRFAEPPAHDRWIPTTGTRKSSQANLTAHYVAPWQKNLSGIRTAVLEQLSELFDVTPPPAENGPKAVMRHLAFLSGGPGKGGAGPKPPRKPRVTLLAGAVSEGDGGPTWTVDFVIELRNRSEGWTVRPTLSALGTGAEAIRWTNLQVIDGPGATDGPVLVVPHQDRKRILRVTCRGTADIENTLPSREVALDVTVDAVSPAPAAVTS